MKVEKMTSHKELLVLFVWSKFNPYKIYILNKNVQPKHWLFLRLEHSSLSSLHNSFLYLILVSTKMLPM